ncbi:WD40-repeat-containing domain protein [Amylocystis lapponica]|nr:WD40-repeat-containing domain protein [Amylocystis lapponica]
MSSTAYVHQHTLTEGHSATINSVAFSPDGNYLASGGNDHHLIIWNTSDGVQLYRAVMDSKVDCIIWHPVHPETLIVGCESGALYQIRGFSLTNCDKTDINVGVRGAIYCLDYSAQNRCLAIGMGREVHVTHEKIDSQYSGDVKMPAPSNPASVDNGSAVHSADCQLHAVALQFYQSGKKLIVSYVWHGIICWDLETKSQTWRISPPSSHPNIGHSVLGPEDASVLTYNLVDGLHLYILGADQQKPCRLYKLDVLPRSKHAVQVAFLHQGRAVVCGTTTGRVCIWETVTGEFFQILSHDGTSCFKAASSTRAYYIATASAGKNQETYIKIWCAKVFGQSVSFTY